MTAAFGGVDRVGVVRCSFAGMHVFVFLGAW